MPDINNNLTGNFFGVNPARTPVGKGNGLPMKKTAKPSKPSGSCKPCKKK